MNLCCLFKVLRGMKKKKIIFVLTFVLLLMIFSGCLGEKKDNDDNEENEEPNISFFADDDDDTVTVAAANPANISWSDIEITGICDTSELGIYVAAGDKITQCSGTISIKYIPTNSILFTYTFTDLEVTPEISFTKDEEENYLIVVKADPIDLNWSDIENVGEGSCNFPTGIIQAGDQITDCFGEITLRWIPANTLLAIFEFSEKEPLSITWVKDDAADTLTISSVEPANVLWGDIEIIGNCNTTGLSIYVTAGDVITECSGTITIRQIPTNTIIGTWDFN